MLSPSMSAAAPDYEKGVELLSKREFEAALREFRGVVAQEPDHAEAHFQIGRILLAGNRAVAAIEAFAQASRVKPTAKLIWSAWAEAVALGGDDTARDFFLKQLRSSTVDTGLRVKLQDRFGSMRNASRPQSGGAPRNAVKALVALMKAQNFKRAENEAKKLLAAHPKSAVAANILATAQANQKKYDLAQTNYENAIKLDPAYSEAYDNYGRFLLSRELPLEAADKLKKAVTLSPDMISALVSLGSAHNQTKEHRSAVVLLERAHANDPEDIQALIELGNAYLRTNRHQEALEAYETARILSKDEISRDHRVSLAQMQSKFQQDEKALENLDQVIRDDPNYSQAISAKASILQSQGKFDEAREYLAKASELDPTNGENYRLFLSSYKAKPGDPIIERMQKLYRTANLTDFDKMNLGFAIAKSLEDSKDFKKVFRYLNEANALSRKSTPYHIRKRYNEIKWLKRAYKDHDYVSALAENGCNTAPIFVTGMPRSGTTLVEQIIASHSTMTSAGELGIGSRLCSKLIADLKGIHPVRELKPDEIAQLGADYTDFISEQFPGVGRITDKTITSYTHIGLLKLAMPNSRFIVVRRDPRDNLLSMYRNKFPEGTHPYAYDMKDLAHYYGTFVEMVDFWRERVPGWFYEVNYDELVSNPEEESRKLIDACGLDWEDACLNFHENKNKVQTLSLYQVRQPISKGSLKGWKRYEKDLEPMIEILREAGHVTD
ncbi:MAG: sulfotransferase [Boseongicola sp.]